ncbi:hypothetical protein GL174_00105 [Sphingobium sp. CAP-1]|nr:hypothetical protein GL174_00105 [Sphingobium sp. CAP-1]
MAAPPAAAPEQARHYYLQGVMETGSELLLRPDGRFQWYLVVGALDLFAEGRWREEGDAILLTAQKTAAVPEPAFDTLRLTRREADLVPPDGHGAYVLAGD